MGSVDRALKSCGVDGLFAAEGEFWKKDRRIVAPHLNHKNVNDYMRFVQIVTKRLMHKWEENIRVAKNIENGCSATIKSVLISSPPVWTSYPWSPLQKMWIRCKKAIEVWGKT